MPDYQTAFRPHKAVLWPAAAVDSHNQPTVEAPVELDVRWVAKRREMVSSDGTPVGIDVVVVVDRDIAEGSIMWRGRLIDWETTGLPAGETLMQVSAFNKTADIKGRAVRRTVSLVRYGDTLPAVV